jgi:hypothetical protein
MSELVTTRIREHATRLGLPHLAENLDLLIQRAEADSMGYREFIDLLLGEELGLREGRRFRTALKLSGLPHHKTLDAFDFAFQPDLDVRKMRVIVRRERPHPGAQLRLTDRDGHRLTAFATNTTHGGPGRQLADLELRHRRRARAEDRIRCAKDTGLTNLPLLILSSGLDHGGLQEQRCNSDLGD